MQGHERYEELCALNVIGQLSADEIEELEEHLHGCTACRDVGEDYGVILDQLPKVRVGEVSGDAGVVRARREQFMRRAQASGIAFSSQAVVGERASQWRIRPKRALWYKTSFVLATAATIGVVFFLPYNKTHKAVQRTPRLSSAMDRQSSPPIPVGEMPKMPVVEAVTQHHDDQAVSIKRLHALEEQLHELKSEYEQASAEARLWRDRFADLSTRSAGGSWALADAKERVTKLEASQAGMLAALVEKEDKVRDLSAQMSAQSRTAERERELNAAATDVRQLMAARNLHIIDVADVDKRGKTKKSFGRVFYVEGQSLLFYAFDLDETASPSKVLFQAWGQQEGAGGKPRNLGIFQVDDQAQKRWVLRVDDPQLLASIDSLFVTVEPSPGADQPTGRRLIYAFLGTPANHP